MKRNLLTVGALLLSLGQVDAQFLTYVGKDANVSVTKSALVYNGGGVNVVQGGKVENSGDVKVVGNGSTSEFKTAGSNHFVLKLNDNTNFANYGQLHIDGIAQDKISGNVDKEYRDASHGKYQQMALPFSGKLFSDLNTEIPGIALTNERWNGNKATGTNVLYYDNAKVVSRLKQTTERTTNATEYYIIGTKNVAATYFPGTTSTIKGVPFANSKTATLSGAGAGVNFGTDGSAKNEFLQKYSSYVTDAWDLPSGAFKGNFGKNMYQYGNPYLTNLDLSLIDAPTKGKIQGIRYAINNTSTNLSDVANSKASYINFTANQSTPVGDVAGAIIKPMQVFIVKLKPNQTATLDFDALRTFDYTPKTTSNTFAGIAGQSRRAGRIVKQQTESVKQLDVIALDKNHNEIDRTYYVVYPTANTGATENYTVQATADNTNVIGTFEEAINGGIDKDVQSKYWLYINEANEVDFKGKKVHMGLYSDNIAYLKFVVRENANELANNQTLSSGESFYVSAGKGKAKKVSNGETIAVSAKSYGLYYGDPENSTLNTDNPAVAKPSSTILVLDSNDSQYKLIFDNTWKTANVQIFDISGRLVDAQDNVKADAPHTLNIPKDVKSTFVVVATSEAGQKFSQKVKTN